MDRQLYCRCRTPYDPSRFYILCELCGEWLHGDCVSPPISEEHAARIEHYACDACVASTRARWSTVLAGEGDATARAVELRTFAAELRAARSLAWPCAQSRRKGIECGADGARAGGDEHAARERELRRLRAVTERQQLELQLCWLGEAETDHLEQQRHLELPPCGDERAHGGMTPASARQDAPTARPGAEVPSHERAADGRLTGRSKRARRALWAGAAAGDGQMRDSASEQPTARGASRWAEAEAACELSGRALVSHFASLLETEPCACAISSGLVELLCARTSAPPLNSALLSAGRFSRPLLLRAADSGAVERPAEGALGVAPLRAVVRAIPALGLAVPVRACGQPLRVEHVQMLLGDRPVLPASVDLPLVTRARRVSRSDAPACARPSHQCTGRGASARKSARQAATPQPPPRVVERARRAHADDAGERALDMLDVPTQTSLRMRLCDWAAHMSLRPERRARLLNLISLECSATALGSLVQPPTAVRAVDWAECAWPCALRELKPRVSRFCLMGSAGSWTDFHVDFGGTSVWYHVVRGAKTFFLAPPSARNLHRFELWSQSELQAVTFFGREAEGCARLELSAGDTLFIPTGWIHAVHTPTDSLVFGGNFLHGAAAALQLEVSALEGRMRVGAESRYPRLHALLWFAALRCARALGLPAAGTAAARELRFAAELPQGAAARSARPEGERIRLCEGEHRGALALVQFLAGLCDERLREGDEKGSSPKRRAARSSGAGSDIDAPALLGGWNACAQLVRELCEAVGGKPAVDLPPAVLRCTSSPDLII
ncbi:hypothetical protein KFE25_000533 [Diacronema lutheri]|uniref:[histone H3]-dimethyl-L-lysine(36) demethylase n=1 Tax=Diacronema lutheri TaxID=2081491 RepID=A0A8J5XRI5_DIALT|nr:hypothetical protein KFE25_000533 [Diacronema lutheri]